MCLYIIRTSYIASQTLICRCLIPETFAHPRKDPAKHISPYRMKATMDETSLKSSIDNMVSIMGEQDWVVS